MVPVVNKPIIEHIIDLLKLHEITEIIITLHYMPEEIMGYLGDGSDFGVKIHYSVEGEPLGTAGSVKKVEHLLDEPFLIISGDALTDFDLTKIIEFHRAQKAVATITLARVENPLEYGVVITDDDRRIRRFLEKPGWGEVFSDTINTGIYVLNPEIFSYMHKNKVYDFSKDLFPILLSKDVPMYGYVASGYWCDIGNLQAYRQANQDILGGRVKAKVPGYKVRKDVWIGEGSVIDPKAEIQGPCVIGKNCHLKERAGIQEFTLIGDNCIVEEGALLQRTVLWNNVYIGKKSRLTGCLVGIRCTVKANTIISEGAVIGDKCFLGQGSVIHPQVKVWPEKNIEAGATVSMSLIWGAKWPGTLFGAQGISGLANIEITPEFAMKLGAAYGACFDKGTVIVTSRDGHAASRMINRATICGLISVGVNVSDYRFMPSPVTRAATKLSRAKAGIHVRVSPKDPRSLLIEFFDTNGINIDRGMERKIENIFFREDFRRTSMEEVGSIDFPARAVDQHLEWFLKSVDGSVIKKAGFKVVIDYSGGNSSLVLPLVLGRLGCETVSLNANLDPEKGRLVVAERVKSHAQLADIVTTLNADMGLWLDLDGEKMVIVDEQGKVISGFSLFGLLASMVLEEKNEGIIASPILAPSLLEKVAEERGGSVIRTKSDPRSLMATALSEKSLALAGDGEGGFIFPQFLPAFDAMFAFVKILELAAKSKKPISSYREALPPYYLVTHSVECSWEEKGRIMRKLIESARDKPVEMLEGLKVRFEPSYWILVLPDPAEPALHLYAEGRSQEEAEELIRQYEIKIDGLKDEEYKKEELGMRKSETKREKAPRKKAAVSEERGAAARQITVLPEEKAFYFWSDNHFLGIRASSLDEFKRVVEDVDPSSLRYHLHRGDFQTWLTNELGEGDLAKSLGKVDLHRKEGEELREEMLRILKG